MTPAGNADDARTTDGEPRVIDVPLLLRHALTLGGPHRSALSGDGSVAAALRAEELEVPPRSLARLAELVRSGGAKSAAGLPEPLPGEEPARLAREWLVTAGSVAGSGDVAADETVARRLEAVAAVLALRRESAAG